VVRLRLHYCNQLAQVHRLRAQPEAQLAIDIFPGYEFS
jgi:hypothetical protein